MRLKNPVPILNIFFDYCTNKELAIKALQIGGDLNLVDKALWLDLDILSSYKRGCIAHSMNRNYWLPTLGYFIFHNDTYLKSQLINCDREFSMKLLSIDGSFMRCVADKFVFDEELVILALQTYRIGYLLSPSMLNRYDVMRVAIKIGDGGQYKDFKSYHDNREFILLLITYYSDYFKELPPELQDDEEIATLAIIDRWQAFKYVSSRLKRDKSLLLKMLEVNIKSFRLIDKDLQTDPDVLLTSIEKSNRINKYDSDSEEEMGGNGIGGDNSEEEISRNDNSEEEMGCNVFGVMIVIGNIYSIIIE